jgi:hypothetical protein
MAQYKEVLPTHNGWLHELARGEIHPDADQLLQLGAGLDPQQLVEESTIDFLQELREQFTEFARIFNGYSESGKIYQEAKIYSLAQTAADFMIFRNQVKLVFSNTAHGMIQVSFAQHQRGALAVDGQMGSTETQFGRPQDLLAQVGPFRDIYWTFQGEKVSPEQIAKFYFAEFIRASRDARKTKTSNQLLIEQIKAMLNDKGIQL